MITTLTTGTGIVSPANAASRLSATSLTPTGLTLWGASFTGTGPGVRNPERPRVMPVGAFARWLELARGKAETP